MKKIATLSFQSLFTFFLFISLTFIFSCNNHKILDKDEVETEENDMYNEAAEAQKFEFEKTKDPALGYVPKERLLAAYKYTEKSKQITLLSRTDNVTATWEERGPTADFVGSSNGNIRDGVNQVASGRMKAIWVDLSDATGNTVWVGGIGGGLWKTTNFKTSPATWVPVNDFFTNMSVGSICQDPSNKNIMYFGTGERTYNIDYIRGGGVWKSTDHGVNWTLLSATTNYMNVSKVLCDASGNLYVGTIISASGSGTSGLFRSIDGGTSFTNISPSGIDAQVADFVISSTGRFHVCCGYRSSTPGYRYTDNPLTVSSSTWTSSSNPSSNHLPETSTANYNCILACKGDTLYAVPSNSSGLVSNIYKSTDGGSHWATTTTSPPSSTSGYTPLSNGQGWYCLGIDVNPADANNVIVGSLNCYATTNGGSTWAQKSDWVHWGTNTGQYVHADIQIVKWYASNEVLVGSDGGVFYSPDAGTTFSDRNTGLNIKQFYSCDYDPTLTDYFLAGAQDNGCHKFTNAGLNTTAEITGGDGAIVHIDQDQPIYQFGAYMYNRYRRSTNTWNSLSAINFYRSGTTSSPVDFGSFINPTDYDNTANIMYCGADPGEFFRWSTAQTTSAGSYFFTSGTPSFPTGADILTVSNLTGTVSAVTVSPNTANRIYLGTGSGKLMKIDNADAFTTGSAGTDITGTSFPAGTITCIATGTDDNHLVVCFSNYGVNNVWITTNGGTSWTAIDGNLPDMPVRWAVFDPISSNAKIWIATETGVWSTNSINGASTAWAASAGFPTVRTDMLKYRSSDQTLIAATHARGLWTETFATVLPVNNFVLKGKWQNDQTTELSWEYSDLLTTSFDIESSYNGTDFIKLGTVPSITKTFLDQPLFSDIYYRIKSKNIRGAITYSNTIHLQKGVDNRSISEIKIFPNPVLDELKVAFSASGKGKVYYQVTGVNGQVFWKREEDISDTGDYIRKWNMQSLQPGTYLFTIVYNDKKISQKFSKQ